MTSEDKENRLIGDSNCQNVNAHRPVFIPCSECGLKFTKRALEVHNKSCLENESCSCYVCRESKRKRLKTSHNNNNVSELRKQQRQRFFKKSIPSKNGLLNSSPILNTTRIKPASTTTPVQNYLTDENRNVLKVCLDDAPHSVHKATENSTLPITPVENYLTDENKNILKVCSDAPYSDHRSTESSNGDTGKLDDALPNCEIYEAHFGELCIRELFCDVCKEHVPWVNFGPHILQHCKKDAKNNQHCPECSEIRSSPTFLLMHYFCHISSHDVDCTQCCCNHLKCSDAGSIPLAEHCYAEDVSFQCYICLKFFVHIESLMSHMRLHTSEMTFDCPSCKISFGKIEELQQHMITHRRDHPQSPTYYWQSCDVAEACTGLCERNDSRLPQKILACQKPRGLSAEIQQCIDCT